MTQFTLEADFEANFVSAFVIAYKYLKQALSERSSLATYVTIAMIEAAVNAAAERTESNDVIDILRDLANQVAGEVLHRAPDLTKQLKVWNYE